MSASKRLDQEEAPILQALGIVESEEIAGFGGPGHDEGRGASPDILALLGERVFVADVLTPKGLDDRKQSANVMPRAYALAAEAWGAEYCRFSTGGSTQSLQTILSTIAKPGDTILVAQNTHRVEFTTAIYAGLNVVAMPASPDRERDIEHGTARATLEAMLAEHPEARAAVVVSPTIFGVTSDIAGLAAICHSHDIPLVVDAAWGAAYAFCDALPRNPMDDGADAMVVSVHKTMAALAQGSAMFASGERIDRERLSCIFEMYQTTSPSVPILASIDATRREHVRHGQAQWRTIVDRADRAREGLAAIDGIVVRGREMIDGDGIFDIDPTKVVFDVSGLGMTGSQADEWLQSKRKVSVVVSDNRHLVAVFGIGSPDSFVERLVEGVRDLADAARADPSAFSRVPPGTPLYADLTVSMAMPAPDAFYGSVEHVAMADAVGRIAAEIVAPAPPEIPRLMPGQRIEAVHVAFLAAARKTGAIIADPAGHGADRIRVVREPA